MADYILQMWELALEGHIQGIWFWAAVYVFLICGYSVIYQVRTRAWPSVNGHLHSAGAEAFGLKEILPTDRNYVAKALYSYSVEGTDYQGKRVSSWVVVASQNVKSVLDTQLKGIQRLPNNQVKVFYNPSNPKKSFLVLPSTFGLLFTVFITVLPAVTYWLRFYA